MGRTTYNVYSAQFLPILSIYIHPYCMSMLKNKMVSAILFYTTSRVCLTTFKSIFLPSRNNPSGFIVVGILVVAEVKVVISHCSNIFKTTFTFNGDFRYFEGCNLSCVIQEDNKCHKTIYPVVHICNPR